ncbi:MAG TPA: MerR family transcriptional regulator [Thermoanaerobaculia bacterium]|jgi:DNA-binding transcriptional MerR regulator|nr:MerR family transcriptional regulator [Thermoanaerobaculia bacterium]
MGERFRVGELAKRVGLSVRTLHHWDEVGLLGPSGRTAAGHRLYDEADLSRLQRILSLRQLGLSLAEIGAWLARSDRSLADDLEVHLARLEREIAKLDALRRRLDRVVGHLRATGTISVDDLFACMESTMNLERHFTPEQMETIERRGKELGADAIARTQTEWTELIAEVQAAMARGADPASPEVQGLAARWRDLVERFTGGDAGITAGVRQVWQQEGDEIRARHGGPDPAMFEYMGRAFSAKS